MFVCVLYSDIDFMQCMFYVLYCKYYIDCVINVIDVGVYCYFEQDICWYLILEVDIEYRDGLVVGEMFEVQIWQDDENF